MLKREQYVFTVRRPYAPLFLTMIWQGMAIGEYYKGLVDEPCPIFDTLEIDGDVYYSQPDLDRATRIVWREWQDPNQMARARRILDKREADLLAATGKDFKTFQVAYEKYSPAILLPWRAEEPVAKTMRQLLSKKCSPQKVEELMSILNIPLQDNLHKQEEYELAQTRHLRAHVKKYEWLKSRYGAVHPYTVVEAKAKLKELNKTGFLAQYRKEKKHIREAIKKAKQLLGKDKHLVDFMQFIVYYRTHRTDTLNRAQYLFVPQLKKMAKERGLTYWQLLHCSRDEVAMNKIPSRRELSRRLKDHASILEDGVGRCVSGPECDKIRALVRQEVGDVKAVKGAAAYKGLARGRVRLIFSTADFSKVKAGDIIITSMTNPHMIPIMKKAAAFVTNEGGITCHAAILSRELKKPCVIGTRVATKVFKDGDMVEVDAEKGIVKKLS